MPGIKTEAQLCRVHHRLVVLPASTRLLTSPRISHDVKASRKTPVIRLARADTILLVASEVGVIIPPIGPGKSAGTADGRANYGVGGKACRGLDGDGTCWSEGGLETSALYLQGGRQGGERTVMSTCFVTGTIIVRVTTFVDRGCFVTVVVVFRVTIVVVVRVSCRGFQMHSQAERRSFFPYFFSQLRKPESRALRFAGAPYTYVVVWGPSIVDTDVVVGFAE